MTSPASLLRAHVSRAIVSAFGPEHAAVDPAVHRSQFADYQADAALRLAKPLKQKPLEIAGALAARLELSGICESVTVSPPGFVNFKLAQAYLERELENAMRGDRLGVARVDSPETIVIDYSAPNVAKEMHAGHLRTTIIGDSLARTLQFLGHKTILQNHIGDWGTQFGMLIEHLLDLGSETGAAELSLGALNDFYQAARKKFDGEPGFADRARTRVVALQAGDPRTLELWRVLVESSERYFSEIYRRLGVLLTAEHLRGESSYNAFLAEIAGDLEARGIARIDSGALCVFLPEFKGREGEPLPLIVRKTDGGFGYAATDLAALRYRTRDLGGQRLLYVVGAPQQTHFAMVFATGRLAGYLPDGIRAEHVMFGSVLGADKKMFKARSGESVKLSELLDEAVERAASAVHQKNPDLPAEVIAQVAEQVGMGALKYADLSSDRLKDYVFDWDRLLAFEGNTGPYLQYAHARIRSMQRKADEQALGLGAETAPIRLDAAEERALGLELLDFELAVQQVSDTLQPHKLCNYLYELATRFTAFYEACSVLKAESAEMRRSRLMLSDAARRVLSQGLNLLGIGAPDRM